MILIYSGCKCDLNLELQNFEAGRNLGNLTPHLAWSQSSDSVLVRGTER